MKPLILVFLKLPVPGRVKTRLAATLGPEAACEVYCWLVRLVLERLPREATVRFCYDPPEAGEGVQKWLLAEWRSAQRETRDDLLSPTVEAHSMLSFGGGLPSFAAQSPGDLGARLHAAFDRAFEEGFTRVVAIGTDCVEFRAADFAEAWSRLDSHDAVFGPTGDGGYWLVGLKRPHPELFEAIPWSTGAVLTATQAAARRLGLSVAQIRQLDDVDTADDLRALRHRLKAGPA